MRTLTTALTNAQKVRSPQTRVTCTVEQRGLTPAATPWIWTELVDNDDQSTWRIAAAAQHSDGTGILRFKSVGTTIQQQTITDPTDATQWTDNAWTTIISVGAAGLDAHRLSGGLVALAYDNILDGNVYVRTSTNDGTTWTAATTIYSGGDAAGDLSITWIDSALGTDPSGWLLAFSTFAAGIYNPRYAYFDSTWKTVQGTNNFRASGIDVNNIQTGQTHVDVYRHRVQDLGPSRLVHEQFEAGALSNDVEVDQTQAGLFGLGIGTWRLHDLNLTQSQTLMTTVEMGDGSGAYLGVGGLMYSEEHLSDEPIIFADVTTPNNLSNFTIVESGTDIYLLGDTLVWRGTPQAATTSTLTPISYIYRNHHLNITFQAGIDTLYVGQILVLTRTLSWGDQSGSESIRFYITRIIQGTQSVEVLAHDAVGFLAQARCRRPSILNDGTATGLAQVLRRLCARYGVAATADDSALETANVMPITLQPSESLVGAAYRITSQANAYLVPANDGSFAVTIITPGSSDVSGDYLDTAKSYPVSEAPIHQAAILSDYRRYAFAYIFGQFSSDPEDGGSLGMAAGPALDNTHPLSVSLTNTRYNSQTRVEEAATAEANRQVTLPVTAIIEINADLALEYYDVLSITDTRMSWTAQSFRIRNIIERWETNLLTQELHLGNL